MTDENTLRTDSGLADEAIRLLDRAIDFRAYHHADPCAIRFGFAKDEDRLAAANALDRVFSALAEGAGK